MALRVVQLEELEGLLLELPAFVRQQSLRDVEFPSNVSAWLAALERALGASRLHQTAAIAALRSELVAVEHGHIPAGLEVRGRPTRSKLMAATASGCMKRATDVVSGVVAENRSRFTEAERIVSQIVAAALSSGIIDVAEPAVETTAELQRMRAVLAARPEVGPALAHVQGLVGPHDLLILLDRAITTQRHVNA